MDSIFKALSDKNRRKILHLLREKDMNVWDIKKHFNITWASLSHHLDILKRADLIISKKKWQFIFYSLNTSVFEETVKSILNLFSK